MVEELTYFWPVLVKNLSICCWRAEIHTLTLGRRSLWNKVREKLSCRADAMVELGARVQFNFFR